MASPDSRRREELPVKAAQAAAVGRLDLDDVSLWEQSSQPWELLARPLDGHPFRVCKSYLATSSVILYRETLSAGVRVHGLTPPGRFGVSVPLVASPRSVFWGTRSGPSRVPVTMPGGIDVELGAGFSHLVVLAPLDMLRRRLPSEALVALTQAADRHLLVHASGDLLGFRDWLSQVLEQALVRPEAFDHPAVVTLLEEHLLRWLGRIARTSDTRPRLAYPSLRRRGLDRALEYLRTTDVSRVTATDLCRVGNVSERTMQYAFREHLGMSPLRFLRHLRLHAVRRQLLVADRNVDRVGSIAYRHGFVELGRFAADYRRLFGELPSETLAHGSRTAPSSLILG